MRESKSPRPVHAVVMLMLGTAVVFLASSGVVVGASNTLVRSDGPAPDLFLVYTGDVIGYVEPCG